MQDKTSTVSKLQHRVEKRYLQQITAGSNCSHHAWGRCLTYLPNFDHATLLLVFKKYFAAWIFRRRITYNSLLLVVKWTCSSTDCLRENRIQNYCLMKSDWFWEIDVGESEQIISLNFEWTHSLLAKQ